MAYVLGFFAADGYITVNRRGGQFWCIQITDKPLLEKIKRIIDAEHVISVRNRAINEKTAYRIQIGSIEMCNDLRKLGFGERKTKHLILPSIPKKFFSDFVRGYFDGDGNVWMGYIHKDRKIPMLVLRIVFTSCSGYFLSALREKLSSMLNTAGAIISETSYSRLQYSIRDSLKLYYFMYNGFGKSRLYLPRKRDVFKRYIQKASLRS